jgi:membrane associated rhomboid family serine protease
MEQLLLKVVHSPVATLIFLVTIATSLAAFQNQWIKEKLILRPYAFAHRKQFFTIITSGLIHADWMHLGMNMLTFWWFAFNLEGYFVYLQCLTPDGVPEEGVQTFNQVLGHSKFFLIYFASLIISDFTTILKYKDIPGYASLGASGAISGLVISTVVLAPAMHHDLYIMGILPGWAFAILYIVSSYISAKRRLDNVGHEAHMWGAIAGLVFTFILMPHQSWVFVEMLQDTFYGWMK